MIPTQWARDWILASSEVFPKLLHSCPPFEQPPLLVHTDPFIFEVFLIISDYRRIECEPATLRNRGRLMEGLVQAVADSLDSSSGLWLRRGHG